MNSNNHNTIDWTFKTTSTTPVNDALMCIESEPTLTLCGNLGKNYKSLIKALRGLADALEKFAEVDE